MPRTILILQVLKRGGATESSGSSPSESHNNAKFREYQNELRNEERSQIYDENGNLKPEVINNSDEIMNGTELGNTDLKKALTADGSRLEDWNKMSYQIRQLNPKGVGPTGEKVIEIHYYYNKTTNKFLMWDYKAKFSTDFFKQTPTWQELR